MGVQNPENQGWQGGAARTFGEGLRRSTVAHFACKVRGNAYCGGQTRLKSNKVMPQSAGHIRYVFVALTLQAK